MRRITRASSCLRLGMFALAILFDFSTIRISAQPQQPTSNGTFDLDKDRLTLASLNGLWRYHAGDDPAYSDPAFDDSAWQLVSADQSQTRVVKFPYGSASFWYRTRIFVPADSPPLSLYVAYLPINYEIFVDGQRIGGIGAMPPHPTSTDGISTAYALPANQGGNANHPRTLSIAIRCWRFVLFPALEDQGLGARIRIGATPLIQESVLLHTRNTFWYSAADLFLALLNTLAGLTAIGFFLFRRQEKEYLWYSLLAGVTAATHAYSMWAFSHAHGWPLYLLVANVLWQASSFALLVFVDRLLSGRRDRLFWIAVSSIFLNLLLALANFVPYIFRPEWKFADIRVYNGLSFLLFLPFATWVIVLVSRKAVAGRVDARLLLPALVLVALCNVLNFGVTSFRYIFPFGDVSWDWFFATSEWPIPFSMQNLAELLLLFTMLAVLTYRFTRTRILEENYEREREAARSVQQVLIPEAIPAIPGFRIASIYKPFGEVGCDFFQVIAIESGAHAGSVLVVIGDVSGKGLPAAMTVSLLVGTVRTLAHFMQNPGEVLTQMNLRMIGRSSGGFTTCLVLRAAPDGTVTVANAGHISPYVNSGELPLENGLPLGLSADSTYPETTFHLAANDQLTLLTDGVVEARSKTGELFGFDRTRSVSRESPESIAQTASHFGQDDDITVLSVCRT